MLMLKEEIMLQIDFFESARSHMQKGKNDWPKDGSRGWLSLGSVQSCFRDWWDHRRVWNNEDGTAFWPRQSLVANWPNSFKKYAKVLRLLHM